MPDDKTGGGGTTQVKALVPQLYVKVQSGDLDGTGTLIAGKDVNNIGGQLDAASSLRASAGRDLNVTTTTSATNINGTNTNSLTRIDRVAGLYVTGQGTRVGANGGMLVATAGRDINLTAAAIQAQGSIALGAGNNLNLGVVTTASQNTQNQGPNNQKTENQKTEGQVLQYDTLLASSEPNRYSFEIS